jgi:hypothetical protein
MSWKKAVFFGGAVLLLAACDNATAPNSPSALNRRDLAAVSSTKNATTQTDSTTVPGTPRVGECHQAVIHTGIDWQTVLICPMVW